MIEIKKLTKKDIARKVLYRNYANKLQEGRITSWNDRFIFVDYYNSGIGSATKPEDLEFI
jgi:hypothetical protein